MDFCPVVFDVEPDMIREGGTIPIAKTFEDVTGKSIIMLPIGGFDDGLHSQNEKISRYLSVCVQSVRSSSFHCFPLQPIHSYKQRRNLLGKRKSSLILLLFLFCRYNYIEGTKLFISFLHEVSQIKKR